MNIERLTTSWWALRVGLGAAALLAGLDKFFNVLADWPGYLSPIAAQILPLSPSSSMHVIGVVEMLVGGVILAGYTRFGGYVAAIWLVCIVANLLTAGHYYDVAVRDVAIGDRCVYAGSSDRGRRDCLRSRERRIAEFAQREKMTA
jgi:uncharacterized membrane protein YphA (DoxX/SURF4 family)